MLLVILLHVVFSTAIGTFLAAVSGNLTPAVSLIALAGGTWAALWARRVAGGRFVPDLRGMGTFESVVYSFLVAFGLRHFVYLVFTTKDSVKMLLSKNFGDLPLHLTYINHMASGAAFPPADPVWGFDKLRYAFGIDFYNAMLSSVGVPETGHMFLAGFALLLVSIGYLRRWGGLLAVGAFFFNGGFDGWRVFLVRKLGDFQDPLAWKNFFLTIFLTQRGYLVALPLGALLLQSLHEALVEDREFSGGELILLGLLWGLMPLFHLHTFILVSLVAGGYLCVYPARWRRFVRLLVPALLPATVVVLYLTNLLGGAGRIIRTAVGWMAKEAGMPVGIDDGALPFWFRNLGPWLVLLVGAIAWNVLRCMRAGRDAGEGEDAARDELRRRIATWGVPLVLFLLFNFVIFAPWVWDNVKLILWVYLMMVVASREALDALLPVLRRKIPFADTPYAKGAGYGVLFFSGFVCVLSTVVPSQRGVEMIQRRELYQYAGAVKTVDHDALIAASNWARSRDNAFKAHPVSYLGYRIPLGYIGHIGSHGYDYGRELGLLEDLYRNGSDWRKDAAELGVDYILYGPLEREKFGEVNSGWRLELANLSDVPGYELYRVVP